MFALPDWCGCCGGRWYCCPLKAAAVAAAPSGMEGTTRLLLLAGVAAAFAEPFWLLFLLLLILGKPKVDFARSISYRSIATCKSFGALLILNPLYNAMKRKQKKEKE